MPMRIHPRLPLLIEIYLMTTPVGLRIGREFLEPITRACGSSVFSSVALLLRQSFGEEKQHLAPAQLRKKPLSPFADT